LNAALAEEGGGQALGWAHSIEIMQFLSEWEDGIMKRWQDEKANE
jgi:hypothetical protein